MNYLTMGLIAGAFDKYTVKNSVPQGFAIAKLVPTVGIFHNVKCQRVIMTLEGSNARYRMDSIVPTSASGLLWAYQGYETMVIDGYDNLLAFNIISATTTPAVINVQFLYPDVV